jgi:hypothetical protein
MSTKYPRNDPFDILLPLKRRLAEIRRTDLWPESVLRAGDKVASLTETLVTANDGEFPEAVFRTFSPERIKGHLPTPSKLCTDDLAIRAIAALAVLSRFESCLNSVIDSRSGRSSVDRPRDFLDAISAAAQGGVVSSSRRSPRSHRRGEGNVDDDRLFRLLQRPDARRLGIYPRPRGVLEYVVRDPGIQQRKRYVNGSNDEPRTAG